MPPQTNPTLTTNTNAQTVVNIMQKQARDGSAIKHRDPNSEPIKIERAKLPEKGEGQQLKQMIKDMMHRKTDGKTSPMDTLGQIGIMQTLREHEISENVR